MASKIAPDRVIQKRRSGGGVSRTQHRQQVAEYENLQSLGTDSFSGEAAATRKFYRDLSERACTRLSVRQHGPICGIVSVIELIYNTPLIRIVSPETRTWVQYAYETSLARRDRKVVCPALLPRIDKVYAFLVNESTHQTGGYPHVLLFAILLVDNVIESRVSLGAFTTYKTVNGGVFPYEHIDNTDTVSSIKDKIKTNLDSQSKVIKGGQVRVVDFQSSESMYFNSPWFRTLEALCAHSKHVYGGFCGTAEHSVHPVHWVSFTICYEADTAKVVPRTYGGSVGVDGNVLFSSFPIKNVHLVIKHGVPHAIAEVVNAAISKQRKPAPPYFHQWNWRERDRKVTNLNECTMHSLNSTLVNCLGREPVDTWATSGIPQDLSTQVYRAEASKEQGRPVYKTMRSTVWRKSDGQSNPQRNNEVIAQWEQVFAAIDSEPHRVERLDAQQFFRWAYRGKMTADFKYAVAMLPWTNGIAHAVSIVPPKEPDSDNLILVDSNDERPKLLSQEARKRPERWKSKPSAYVHIAYRN